MQSVRLCLSINGKARDHKCTQCDYVILSINDKVRDHKCTKCDYVFLSLTMLETKNALNMIMHGRATEEGRRTGFPLIRYGCQLRASALELSSIWRNLKCLLYRY
jgi:hypothetical protein